VCILEADAEINELTGGVLRGVGGLRVVVVVSEDGDAD